MVKVKEKYLKTQYGPTRVPFNVNVMGCFKLKFKLQVKYKNNELLFCMGTAVAEWLSCCVTSRKVAGSIPDGVIGIFH